MSRKVKGVVDFVFAVDVSASMGPCIEALAKGLSRFIDELVGNPQTPVRNWRGRVFGFRDARIDDEAFVAFPFVEGDSDALKDQLNELVATGGGDTPESLLDALWTIVHAGETAQGATALEPMRWRHRRDAARVVIVFTDAAFHPTLSIPEAEGGTLDDVANAVMEHRVYLHVFAPELPGYASLSEIDRAEFQPICGPREDPQAALRRLVSNTANFHATLEMLARSVSRSAAVEVL